ncbi:hypothetical protein [Sporisorium scitamineum]|uniref:Uncharacterized protein n=1 Tax=Sporisorium scitamineum TaxID=49012 RepID=A0A0F7S4K8_9BASI|nr:hypothetical protein [Sporisorium scitamineum]
MGSFAGPFVAQDGRTSKLPWIVGLAEKTEKASRKLRKERKNRAKKVRGTKKTKAGDAAKKK